MDTVGIGHMSSEAMQTIWIATWLRRNALRSGKELSVEEADLQARLMPEEERKAHLVAIALESKPLVISGISNSIDANVNWFGARSRVDDSI